MTDSALSGFRVLDLTDDKGFLCGQILASLGADVIKVEKPGGDPTRYMPPFYHDVPGPNNSLYWNAYNTGKRSIVLDLESNNDKGLFKKLVKTADFVIESFKPGYLDKLGIGYENLSQINPGIIMTSITPFGQKGPYSSFRGSDLIVQAMGVSLSQQGDPDRPPVRVTIPQAYVLASAEAAEATMVAFNYRSRTGKGQHVDVSATDTLIWLASVHGLGRWLSTKHVTRRTGNAIALGEGLPAPSIWECKDGYVNFMIFGGQIGFRTNKHLTEWMESENAAIDFMKGRDWLNWDRGKVDKADLAAMIEAISRFFKARANDELQQEAFKRDIQLLKVNEISDLLSNNQLSARDFWVDIYDERTRETITYPGAFAKLSLTPLVPMKRPPSIGEHSVEIKKGLASLPESKVPSVQYSSSGNETLQEADRALDGLKVLAFVVAGVGPMMTQALAAHGAIVVHVESSKYPDPTRTVESNKDGIKSIGWSWLHAFTNPETYSLALDLKHPRATEMIKRLVTWADVIVDNFRPGVMERLGLGFNDIQKINPRTIVVSSSQLGQSGPNRTFAGVGPQLAGYAGFTTFCGWPDRPPISIGPYPDHIAPRFGNASLLAAFEYQKKTGKGQFIDVSQLEASIHLLTPAVLNYTINKRSQTRDGNKCPYAAPHGVYRCKGDDRWCAIAVFDDTDWEALCRIMGNPEWTKDGKFSSLAGRKQFEDELNLLIEQWTCEQCAEEVMLMLQEANVEAGVVRTIDEVFKKCLQLEYRHYWWDIEYSEMGAITCPGGHSYLLSKTPYRLTRPSPFLGEHTEYICTKLLGMSDEDFIDLYKDGIF